MTLTALRARTLVFRELDLIRGVEIAPEPVGRRAAGDRQPSTLGRGRRRLAQDLELLIGRPCTHQKDDGGDDQAADTTDQGVESALERQPIDRDWIVATKTAEIAA